MTKKRSDSTDSNLCQFSFSDGRRCRMLRHPRHPSLCLFHAHDELQILESQLLGAEVSTTLTSDFLTSADVNHALGKVFTALAQGRIPQRTAATLGYLGQIMHQGMPTVRAETQFYYKFEVWQDMLRNRVRLSPRPPLFGSRPAPVATTEISLDTPGDPAASAESASAKLPHSELHDPQEDSDDIEPPVEVPSK